MMEYEDYLKLYGLLVGDKEKGSYAVSSWQMYPVTRMTREEFVKTVSKLEAARERSRIAEKEGNIDGCEVAMYEVGDVRRELLLSYWERMQESGLKLVLQKGGIS